MRFMLNPTRSMDDGGSYYEQQEVIAWTAGALAWVTVTPLPTTTETGTPRLIRVGGFHTFRESRVTQTQPNGLQTVLHCIAHSTVVPMQDAEPETFNTNPIQELWARV